jgi:tetratricopeptide (TPR) repeat protein
MDPKESPTPPDPDQPPPEQPADEPANGPAWMLPDVTNLTRRERLDLYFNDPFKGRERKFYWFGLPAIFVVVVLLIVLLLILPAPYDNVEERTLAVQNAEKPLTPAEVLQSAADRAMGQKRLADAEVFFREITTLDPSSIAAWNNLAVVYLAGGHPAAALEATEKALAINPEAEHPRFNRAIIKRQLGQTEEALADLRALAKSHPGEVNYATHLTLLRLQTKDPTVAGEIATYRESAPPSLEPLWIIGAIGLACAEGRTDEARQLLARAEKVFDPTALNNLLADPFFDPHRSVLGLKERGGAPAFRDARPNP